MPNQKSSTQIVSMLQQYIFMIQMMDYPDPRFVKFKSCQKFEIFDLSFK